MRQMGRLGYPIGGGAEIAKGLNTGGRRRRSKTAAVFRAFPARIRATSLSTSDCVRIKSRLQFGGAILILGYMRILLSRSNMVRT